MGEADYRSKRADSIVGNLLRATLEHAYYQGARLSELSRLDFPFVDCKHVILFITGINEAVIERLDRLEAEVGRAPGDRTVLRDAQVSSQRFGHLLNVMDDYLRLLEFSTRTHISQGSVNLLDALTAGFKKNERFILVPEYEFNYSYIDILRHLNNVVADAGISIRNASRDLKSIAVLSYPNIFKENALANCVLAHELGHFVIEQANLVRGLLNNFTFDDSLLSKLVDEAKSAKIGSQSRLTEFFAEDFIKSRIMKDALEKLNAWETELASDLFAFRMVGPVYIYSLSRFLLTIHEMDATNDHPSARVRLKLLLKELKAERFVKLTGVTKQTEATDAAVDKHFEKLGEFLDSPRRRPESKINMLLVDSMTRLQPKMLKAVDKVFESKKV